MYNCADCRPPYRSERDHADDARPKKSCNWLDWMIEDNDGVCLHCGGPVEWFKPAPLGQILDGMG